MIAKVRNALKFRKHIRKQSETKLKSIKRDSELYYLKRVDHNMKESMERIDAILQNKDYIRNLKKNKKAEKGRIFCKHDMDHFLDVARIAYIINLEERLGYGKELIYAAALLHDIGKWKQYQESIPHSKSSAEVAQQILPQCGFYENEIQQIVEAILSHTWYNTKNDSLRYLLYKGDKLSRKCFLCPAFRECKWEDEAKNIKIEV